VTGLWTATQKQFPDNGDNKRIETLGKSSYHFDPLLGRGQKPHQHEAVERGAVY